MTFVDGTVYKTQSLEKTSMTPCFLPDYEEHEGEIRRLYARELRTSSRTTPIPFRGKAAGGARIREHLFIVQNPPAKPLTQEEMDEVYDLPLSAGGASLLSGRRRTSRPFREIKFSLASCRGCFGACSFCALTFHQGRIIQARSHESLLRGGGSS